MINIRGAISKEGIEKITREAKERSRIINEGRELITFFNSCREIIHKEYPVTRLVHGDEGMGLSKEGAYEKIVNACTNAHTAFDEVEKKILNGDMPLCKMDFILEPLLVSEGIKSDNPSQYSQEVLNWIEGERRTEFILNILGAVIPLGLAVACFIPGIGVGAIIALGAIGAGVGGAFAIYEFEIADDLNDAASTSESGSQNLVEVEAARSAYVWGIIGLALSVFDVFIAGKAVLGLLKVTKVAKGIPNGLKAFSGLSEARVSKLAKMDSKDLETLFKILGDSSNGNAISDNAISILKYTEPTALLKLSNIDEALSQRIITNLDALNRPELVSTFLSDLSNKGLSNLGSINNIEDSFKILNYFDDTTTNVRLLNSIDDYTVLLNPESIIRNYDLVSGRSLSDMDDIFRNWKSQTPRSVEEIAVILKNRPLPPRVIARVQGANFSTFGNKVTTFITDPSDIIGLNIDDIAKRLGFDDGYRQWISSNPNRGLFIDFVELPPDANVVRMSWDKVKSDFRALVNTGDEDFLSDLLQIRGLDNGRGNMNINKLNEMLDVISNTAIEKSGALSDDLSTIQGLINDKLGANELFTGQHYTADYNFNIGTTEWGFKKPGVGLELEDMINAGYEIKRFHIVGDQIYPLVK